MANAKRILLCITQADWGGAQSFVVRFATDLKRHGHEVLIAAGGEGELWAEAARAGVPTHRLVHMTREISPLQDWRAVRELRALIETFKPDAIHLNSSKMGALGSLAASSYALRAPSSELRVIYRIGGWSFLEPIAEWKRWIYRATEQLTARYKDVIITVHPDDERIARELHITPRQKLVTVPNGLDLPAFATQLYTRSASREALGLPAHAFIFGTVANAYATKGLLPYLDTVAKIAAANANVYFVILGDGPEFDALTRKRHELGLDNRLILTGHRDDASRCYPAFDVFVLPSRKEGMPWTVLEAMAAGIPCVTTDVGACRWMIESPDHARAGIVVPLQDSLALVEALRALLNSPERRDALGRGGQLNSQQRFSWSETYKGNRDALLHPRSTS